MHRPIIHKFCTRSCVQGGIFSIAKPWKQHKYLSTEWINGLWHIHTMKYFIAVKMKKLQGNTKKHGGSQEHGAEKSMWKWQRDMGKVLKKMRKGGICLWNVGEHSREETANAKMLRCLCLVFWGIVRGPGYSKWSKRKYNKRSERQRGRINCFMTCRSLYEVCFLVWITWLFTESI